MPRACSICTHPEREAINAALVGPDGYRAVAQRFATSPDAMYRHKADHLPATLAKAEAAKDVALADDLLAQLKQLRNKALGLLMKAEHAGDLKTAMLGVREARACIELLAEMEGQVNRTPTVNILIAPEWIAVRSRLMGALADYPEARASVALALREADYERG